MERDFIADFPWSVLRLPSVRRLSGSWLVKLVLTDLGWIWPFMFTSGVLLFTKFDGSDPLLWRSFSNTDPLMVWMKTTFHWEDFSDHHMLDLLSVALVTVGLAAWFARVQHTTIARWGLLASYGGVMVWSVHEGIWWLVYYAFWRPDLIVYSGFGEIVVASLLLLTPVMGLYRPGRFIAAMAGFYLLWSLAGFPITLSYHGQTPLYLDFGANAWEVASWAYACAAFYLLERDGLLGWWVKIDRLISQNPLTLP